MIESDGSGALLLLDAESARLLSSITEMVNKSLRRLVWIAVWYFNCLFGILAVVSSLGARRPDDTICTAPMGANIDNLSTDCLHPPMHYDLLSCALVMLAVVGILVSMIVGRIALRRLQIEGRRSTPAVRHVESTNDVSALTRDCAELPEPAAVPRA